MRTNSTFLTTSAIALSFLIATPALAHSDKEAKLEGSAHANAGLHLGSLVSFLAHERNDERHGPDDSEKAHQHSRISGTVAAINGTTLTVTKGNDTFAVNVSGSTFIDAEGDTIALSDINVGDYVTVRGSLTNTVMVATSVRDHGAQVFTNNAATIGTIASVNGSTFVISPIGTTSNVTIETTADTIFRGQASDSSDLSTGHGAFVIGSTSSTSPNTLTASIVVMFEDGLSFFKHLFQ